MEERTCEICGEALKADQKKFCSVKHWREWQKSELEKRKRICEVCGVSIYRQERRYKRFCSWECKRNGMDFFTDEESDKIRQHYPNKSRAYMLKILPKRTWEQIMNRANRLGVKLKRARQGEVWDRQHRQRLKLVCEICGKPRPLQRKRCCSMKCWKEWMSKNDMRRTQHYIVRCDNCGKVFDKPECQMSKRHYCSRTCYHEHGLRLENHPNWHGGTSFLPHSVTFTEKLREQIRDRDNRECQYCGVYESELDRKLEVHHINYDKMDDRKENLIALCKSCHTKTGYRRFFWEALFRMSVQEKDSIQSRLHLVKEVKT